MLYGTARIDIVPPMDLAAMRLALRAARKARVGSLDKLAARAGIHKGTIQAIEKDEAYIPKIDTLTTLIEAMEMTVSSFFAQVERPTSADSPLRDDVPIRKLTGKDDTTVEVPTAQKVHGLIIELSDWLLDVAGRFEPIAEPTTTRQARSGRRQKHRTNRRA